ncbi:hypothetical protein evm_004228 [Chilo suppressalis]|nr:hypothetical protein evm_004228 [Chilo suppressalis]
MDNSTYPDNSNSYEFATNANQELDFVDHWANFTIEEEILRGKKIRDEKSRTCVPQTECKLVDIHNSKTSYRAKSSSRCRTRQPSNCYNSQAFCSSPRSPSIKVKCAPRCPLRIAELAVPTKRQCIETWRTKCDILPPFMVERLKQQVMDERPIVHITDAVNCFKRATSKSTKTFRRHKMPVLDSKLKNERMLELSQLCAIFGKKIAQKLITPQNIKLNPELDKISKIVADELAHIMRSGNIGKRSINDKMDAEISAKNICSPQTKDVVQEDYSEKSSHKSGEDRDMSVDISLDPLKNIELDTSPTYENITSESGDIIVKEGNDNTIATGLMHDEINRILDNIVRNASDKDEPKIEQVDKNQSSDLVAEPGVEIELVDNQEISSIVVKESVSNNSQILVDKESVNKIHNIMEDLEGNTQVAEKSDEETINASEVIRIEHNTPASEGTNLESDNINAIDDLEQSKAENKVSDVFGMVFAEESHDDKNKKVQFSDIHLGKSERKQFDGNEINGLQKSQESNKLGTTTSTTSENINSNMVFAPPNKNLLSDADELWPEDIANPTPKATTIVSRSVTSLGNITEKEEKVSITISERDLEKEIEDFSYKNIGENLRKGHTKEENIDLLKAKTGSKKIKNGTDLQIKSLSDPQYDNRDSEINKSPDLKLNDGIDKTIPDSRVPIEKSDKLFLKSNAEYKVTDPISKLNTTEKDKLLLTNTNNDSIQKGNIKSDKNVIYQADEQKLTSLLAASEPKFDYKVNPNTAPSWLQHDHGKGEPSEDSIDCRDKGRFNEHELRIWCKDLERMLRNLDLWNTWLETTCKNMLFLIKKRGAILEMNKSYGTYTNRRNIQEWIILKKNMEKDSIFWSKLNYRAYAKLRTYKARIVSTKYYVLCDCKNNLVKKKL